MTNTNKTLNSWKYELAKTAFTIEQLEIIQEQSVDLLVNNSLLLTFFCSPIQLEALALGFLWNEGIINDLSEIKNLRISPDMARIEVSLFSPIDTNPNLIRTSTGLTVIRELEKHQMNNSFRINPEMLIKLYDEFSAKQKLHQVAGGYHSAALSDGERINIITEDLGRHNCLDKISGMFLLEGKPFTPQIILLSGRISSEMIHKAINLTAPIIATRTTPTVKAVEIAKTHGVAIVGYLRGKQFSVFSFPERIQFK